MLPSPKRRRPLSLKAIGTALTGVLVGSLLALGAAPAAQAAGGFNPGLIITDQEFFNGNAMSANDVQAFLSDKGKSCKPASGGPACLKDYKADLPAMVADKYCAAVPAKKVATAAEIIAAAGKACGISQRVLLVTLQKEQSLVTKTAPTATNYNKALGMSCPDTAPCDPRAAGFVNQVYLAARQQQVYVKNPNSFRYKPGQVNTIQWHPTASCGSSKVYIENQATANLYIYTPYRPNIAALAAGWGTGDACSTYGNRNFYNYYSQWFGGVPASSGAAGQIPACTVPPAAEIGARNDKLIVTAASLNVRSAPTTLCDTGRVSLAKDTVVQATGTYGAWTRITVNGKAMWATTSYLSPLVPGTPKITGTAAAGQILTADPGSWTPTNATFSYQWQRDGSNISGATGKTYKVTTTDAGKKITVTVTGRVTGYSAVSRTSAAVTPKGYSSTRIAGEDRVETAVELSRQSFPNGTSTAYLVTGADFADALAAAPLAAREDAALLLTTRSRVPDATLAELKRLKPSRIILIGGEVAIDKNTPARLRSALGGGFTVHRLGGEDRYHTARIIAARWSSAETVYIATGRDFADALGAAGVAGVRGAPVLLVNGSAKTIDANTQRTLTTLKATKAVVVGGDQAVSAGIASRLNALKVSVTRYGGADRWATNAALNNASFGNSAQAVVATGEDFPDALTGSVYAAGKDAPIFVTKSTCITAGAADFFHKKGVSSLTLIGGPVALTDNMARLQRC